MIEARVGSPAPDFNLDCTPLPNGRGQVRLSELRGRWLALVFYPRDFSLVCPTELTALDAMIDEFRERGCEILAIGTDSLESHRTWLATPRSRGGLADLGFPLGSDPDGAVSRAYGVYDEAEHAALRGLFLIDPEGVLQYQVVHNMSVGRRPEDVLRVLDALRTGGLCPSDWSAGSPTVNPEEVLGPGRVVSHYRIEETLGTGSFGTVFRAHDMLLLRTVALKVLRPSAKRSALDEARSAASLNHPNICTLYSIDNADGVPLIAMEYLSGRTLNRVLEREGSLPPDAARVYSYQIALGLAAAHGQGVVHGDLKPENVMVTDEQVVKLLDFGLSRRFIEESDPDATVDFTDSHAPSAAGVVLAGTPSYMSPEQTRGEPPTPASDVFALGAIIYELLTGRKAFEAENVLRVLSRIRSVDAEHLASRLPPPFQSIARAALQRDPDQRAITMSEIAALLA
jgi:alkyl hydroperoxide reductase subunit AhpC